jgi:trehalose 6-phosphate synthase
LWRSARAAELAPQVAQVDRPAGGASDDRTYDHVNVSFKLPIWPERKSFTVGQWNFRSPGVGTALVALLASKGGAWIGWSAGASVPKWDDVPLISVELPAEEVDRHQEGYCNSTIWPLYHNAIERPEFRSDWRQAYRIVNQRFADETARIAAPGATIWIHDYQLQLVPAMLRRQRPDLRIGFFLHICLPSVEIFMQLPGREEVLNGLLGADLVGFQQPSQVQNFLRLVKLALSLETDANSIYVDGRQVIADAFPISTDVAAIEHMVNSPHVRQQAARVRAELGNPRTLLLGVDRLDYTKGIEQRLLAYEAILEGRHVPPDSVGFIQVGTLTRERHAKYASLRERVERLAGHLNGSYGKVGSPVVHLTTRQFGWDEITALYLAADVMVVTPLRDGMNLVAKEYVASRVDNRGVLVLSEFAGAAVDLPEAIVVNPNDVDALKDAILRAIAMSPDEQRQRMEAMRWHLRTHDVHAWISGFLTGLDKAVSGRFARGRAGAG